MRLKLAFAMLACMVVVVGAGCSRTAATTAADPSAPGGDIAAGIPLAPDFRIADIPVPAGFEFDREHSFVFQNSEMDVGRIQYAGKEAVADVAQFYLDEMSRYNWELLSVTEHGTITLFFEKPGKACQVLLSPKGRSTLVQVSFFPKH